MPALKTCRRLFECRDVRTRDLYSCVVAGPLIRKRERNMRLGKSGVILWTLYVAFAAYALISNYEETTFRFSGTLGGIKALVWLILIAFLSYSVYCNHKENFFRSLRSIAGLYWGRQIGTDLYLGLLIALFIIFLNDGLLIALIWLVPILIYANLMVLLYLAINFDSLVANMLGI